MQHKRGVPMNETYNKRLIKNARNLRKNMTKEERHLWYDCLKLLPVTVHRQKVFGNYIVDFYITEAELVIELDGSQHYEPQEAEYDKARTAYLESQGLQVLRIPNSAIHDNFRGVCEYIYHLTSAPKPSPRGEGAPIGGRMRWTPP